MLRRKQSATTFSPLSSNSSSRSRSPAPNDWDADDEDGAMSGDDAPSAQPISISIPSLPHTCAAKRPSLKEILSNSSPPPWTLTAFMAYLSNNHCLETLEFTMDAARYRKHYAKVATKSEDNTIPSDSPEAENMKVLWQRLIEAYIRPNGSREINIPSEVRDPILRYDCSGSPPPPETLDVAVTKVYELMEESVLVPFLNSMSPPASTSPPASGCACESPDEPETSRGDEWYKFGRGRFSKGSPPATSPSDSPPFPPLANRKSAPTSLSNALHRHRLSNRISPTNSAVNSTISHSGDHNILPSLTDDSGYNSAHTNDSLMTPPMGSLDDDLGTSPRTSKDGGWKKFGRLSQWKPKQKKSFTEP